MLWRVKMEEDLTPVVLAREAGCLGTPYLRSGCGDVNTKLKHFRIVHTLNLLPLHGFDV